MRGEIDPPLFSNSEDEVFYQEIREINERLKIEF